MDIGYWLATNDYLDYNQSGRIDKYNQEVPFCWRFSNEMVSLDSGIKLKNTF